MIWRFLPCRPMLDQGESSVGSHPVPGEASVTGDHMPLPSGCASAQHLLRGGGCVGEQAWRVVARASAAWHSARSLRHGRSRGRCPSDQARGAVPKGTETTGTGTVTHPLTRKTAPPPGSWSRLLHRVPWGLPTCPSGQALTTTSTTLRKPV